MLKKKKEKENNGNYCVSMLNVVFSMLNVVFSQSWKNENDRMKEKFLSLLGKIGKDARSSKTTNRVSMRFTLDTMLARSCIQFLHLFP